MKESVVVLKAGPAKLPERRNEMAGKRGAEFLGTGIDAPAEHRSIIESLTRAKGYLEGFIYRLIHGLSNRAPARSMARCVNTGANPGRPSFMLIENLERNVSTIKNEIAQIEERLEKLTRL